MHAASEQTGIPGSGRITAHTYKLQGQIGAEVSLRFFSAATRQEDPDRRVFVSENPRAEALQSVFLNEFVAVFEGMQVGEEDPFSHLVAIKIEIRAVIFRVPLYFAVVGCG